MGLGLRLDRGCLRFLMDQLVQLDLKYLMAQYLLYDLFYLISPTDQLSLTILPALVYQFRLVYLNFPQGLKVPLLPTPLVVPMDLVQIEFC